MVAQAEIDIRPLSYLVTAVIHRLHETDPAWWREFPGEMKVQRNTAAGDVAEALMLNRAVGIVEHALKPETSMTARHGE
jgi:hypothetical protein